MCYLTPKQLNQKFLKRFKNKRTQTTGRTKQGSIVLRHKGNGLRNLFIRYNKYKIASFFTEFSVVRLIYDPNRTAWLALIVNNSGVFQLILAPHDVVVGSTIYYSNLFFSREMLFSPGTNGPLSVMPTGSKIYNIEKFPSQGGVYARSAGCFAKLMIKKKLFSKFYAGVQLPSKKLIYLPINCHAFLGRASNIFHKFKTIRKAGTNRNLGIRPTVRGVAMNPVDHPHGGGEGKASTGPKPKTPWGRPAKWTKTKKQKIVEKQKIFISKMNKLAVSLKTKKMRSSY